jgi:hypothetical protein
VPDAVEVSGSRDRTGSNHVAHAVPVGIRVAVTVDEPVRFVQPVGSDPAHAAAVEQLGRLNRFGHWHEHRHRHEHWHWHWREHRHRHWHRREHRHWREHEHRHRREHRHRHWREHRFRYGHRLDWGLRVDGQRFRPEFGHGLAQ